MKDVFLISNESELSKNSSLANRASKAYWLLKDKKTAYAKSLYACYIMHKRIMDVIIQTKQDYKYNNIPEEKNDE